MSTYGKVLRNIGAIIILGYVVVVILAVLTVTDPSQPSVTVFAFYWTFFSIFLVIIATCARFLVNDPVRGAGFEVRDNSIVKRVILDSHTGDEVVVSGAPDTTYRQAVLDDWEFRSINKNEKWRIEDTQRNDITFSKLKSYDGLAFIIPETPRSDREKTVSPSAYKDRSQEDRYSTLDEGVKFYD